MNKETIEIPLVKATYEELQQVICELQVERFIKDKEIKRLNKKYEDAVADYEEQKYIINELESYLEQQWLEWKDSYNDEIVAMANEDKAILDKLKELKAGK